MDSTENMDDVTLDKRREEAEQAEKAEAEHLAGLDGVETDEEEIVD